ncbi:transporter substrate-binding domain-containing protein [Myxosarcina sp. GI1]|uniref:transporter substrate-binding domain-containing protein n=1 Tax=Myxosarcina sp. GI1 TaxID=1541065 RepID=UPI00055CFD15|nr:transporter substrate-binding domain-containing protein [Myxosarcina sp. GI1]
MTLEFLKALFPNGMRRFVALFLVSLFLTVSIAACSESKSDSVKSQAKVATEDVAQVAPTGTLDDIQAAGKIEIAVPADFPPFGAVGTDMKPRGYDIDVANRIAKGLGVDSELVSVVGNYRIPFLQTDRVDLVISSLGKNEERAAIIDFSQPYAPFFSGVYGRPNVEVASFEELKGQTVGVAQGSLEDLEISKIPPEEIDIKRYANNSLTASALVSGQVNLIATGNVVAAKLIQDNPGQKIERKFIMKNSPCYVGIRKGDEELLAKVNNIITNLKQSGELDRLSIEWFGEPLPKDLAAVT